MATRLLVLAVLAAFSGPAQTPPMFSAGYGEALRDTLRLEEVDAARLESQLAARPDDLQIRLKLMAYYQRGDRKSHPQDRAKRLQNALWLIRYRPDSEILHSPVSRFAAAELPSAGLQRTVALWVAAARAHAGEAAVLWNAASFFEGLDESLYLHYLESTAAADPNHPFALRPLAHLYALSILNRDRWRHGLKPAWTHRRMVPATPHTCFKASTTNRSRWQPDRTVAPWRWRSTTFSSPGPSIQPSTARPSCRNSI